MLDTIIHQLPSFLSLQQECKNNMLAKSILLEGQDKLFLHAYAKELAKLILDNNICGECEHCQKVAINAHPDVKTYPLKDKLLVSDSQEIVLESFVKPVFADKKVFIIRDIDNSMESAQNKLLKVLEEPSQNVYFILTCTSPQQVLPTIRSRCSKQTIGKLQNDQMEMLLPNDATANREIVLAVSEGNIGKAQKLARMKSFKNLCDDAVSILTKLKNSKQVLSFSKTLQTHKESYDLILEVIAKAIEDLVKIKSGKKDLVLLQAYLEELTSVSGEYSVRSLCEIARLLDHTMQEKLANVNMLLALENLLMNILEVKYLCK